MADADVITAKPSQPPAIQRLEDAVVHRIAAGEVVQRPSSALKEMVENSLDAGAKHITVVVKEGGLKYLQIQDDGCGIRLQDMPILCHRHTTSKLRTFEDLETISTLGFRGEALASISFVSHVTVTTMTAAMQHGYRVKYADGEMLAPGPKPVAAVPGTSIIVEDLFYNMLARRRAFKPGPEEHHLLLDVLQRYAVYKAGSVGFTLKRQGEARSDLHTLPTASRIDVIRCIFGPELATSLLPLRLTGGTGDISESVALDAPMGFIAEGYVSNLTYLSRRSMLVLFINGRPVEHGQLRRAIEAVYTSQNPKANKPWVYLDLRLPPRHVEVNMHPTKKEVGFLHQQEVVDEICRAVEQVLCSSMHTRSFAINRPTLLAAAAAASAEPSQQQPPAAASEPADAEHSQRQGSRSGSSPLKPLNSRARAQDHVAGGNSVSQAAGLKPPSSQQPAYRPEKLVRTDHRTQSIEGFLVSKASATAAAAAVAAGSTKRRRSSVPGLGAAVRGGAGSDSHGAGLDPGAEVQEGRRGNNISSTGGPAASSMPDGAAEAGGGVGNGFGGDGVFSNASLHLQAAAAEQVAAAADLAAAVDSQQAAHHEALLRPAAQPRLPAVTTQLASIWELLGGVQHEVHQELQQLFKEHTWVGMVDGDLVLLQHGTRLYLVSTAAITRDLFYQLLLMRWEAPKVMHLARPLPVGQLMQLALQQEEAAGRWQAQQGSSSSQELCELVQALLLQKAEMLQEYVGLIFQQQQDSGLHLMGVPVLLQGYVPDLSRLPHLILHLARDVLWDTEKECFQSVAAALADFYSLQPLLLQTVSDRSAAATAAAPAAAAIATTTTADTAGPGCLRETLSVAQPTVCSEDSMSEAVATAAPAVQPEDSKQPSAGCQLVGMDVDTPPVHATHTQQQQQSPGGTMEPVQATTAVTKAAAAAAEEEKHLLPCYDKASPVDAAEGVLVSAGHRTHTRREWLLRHVVMPAVKAMYSPPQTRARDGSVLLLTSMEKLYKVFERCGW